MGSAHLGRPPTPATNAFFYYYLDMGKSKSGGTRTFIRGRVGSDVYSVGRDAKGKKQQVVRSIAESVANPQTRAQMRGRMIMSTIAQALAVLRPIVDHAFDNVVGARANLSEFTALNYARIKNDIAQHAASGNLYGLNQYQEKGAKRGAWLVSNGQALVPAALVIDKSTAVVSITIDSQNVTVAGLKSALGMTSEEYFTLVGLTADGAALYERFRVNPALSDEDQLASVPLSNIFATEGNAIATVNLSTNVITITLSAIAGCCSIIVSKKSNGGFIHSKAILGNGTDFDYAANVALPTYPVGAQNYLNGGDIFGMSETIGGITEDQPGGGDQPVVGAVLTINKNGSGTATVSVGGNPITSGANVAGGAVVSVDIVPENGKQARATIGANTVSLTEADGHYTGTFNMPNSSATLSIDTAYTSSGGDGGDDLDQG